MNSPGRRSRVRRQPGHGRSVRQRRACSTSPATTTWARASAGRHHWVTSGGVLDATGTCVPLNRPIIVNGGTITGSGELRVRGSLVAASTFTKSGTGNSPVWKDWRRSAARRRSIFAGGIVQGEASALPHTIVIGAGGARAIRAGGTAGVSRGKHHRRRTRAEDRPRHADASTGPPHTGMTTVVTGTLLLKEYDRRAGRYLERRHGRLRSKRGCGTYTGQIGGAGAGAIRKTGLSTLQTDQHAQPSRRDYHRSRRTVDGLWNRDAINT